MAALRLAIQAVLLFIDLPTARMCGLRTSFLTAVQWPHGKEPNHYLGGYCSTGRAILFGITVPELH